MKRRSASGFFNFIESIGKRDIYSYALFPKNEVVGVLSSNSVDLALSTPTSGSPWLNAIRSLQRSQTESVLIGFSESGRRLGQQEERVEFGWVVSMRGKMEPAQKTQLALVSVPAWTSELKLTITTGWLDRNAKEQVEKSLELRVPVPPDFDAFDSLLTGGAVQRKPKISSNLMDLEIKVAACQNAKILIPGSRLWRSATVTLGSQQANRITVLPNMEGIIAEFSPVEVPQVPFDSLSNIAKVKLQVWTSEGVDTAKRDIQVTLPSNRSGCLVGSSEEKLR